MKNAIGYIRVSTDNQAENGFGADVQKEIIVQYAKDHGYSIPEENWSYDLGVSGATDIKARPALYELVYGETYNPPVEAIIVAKSDRISRDINIYYGIRYLLSSKSIELVSAEMDFGQFGAFAPVIESVMATLAELEKEKINQRTTGGRLVKAKRGGYAGGNAPFGYTVREGHLVIVDEEAEVVRQLFRLRQSGLSIRELVKKSAELGLHNRSGRPFSKSGLVSVLNNENTYRGMYKYGEMEWVKGQQEPILEP